MTEHQLQCCAKKLAAISTEDAARFVATIMEAERLSYLARDTRLEAWGIYHQYFPSKRAK